MSFKVTLWHDANLTETACKWYMSRSQAIHGMRKLAYAKLEAFGKLDSQAGHDVMAAIDKTDDLLPKGDQRVIRLSNTGFNLTLLNK